MSAGSGDQLARRWTHAHEEDAEGLTVFRPADYPFAPQRRPRTSIELGPAGEARHYGGPAPADRPAEDRGTWAVEGDELTLRLEGAAEERYRVESVDEEKLVLRRLG